ncbi:MAG: UDP-N-acetylmuramate dehydrogenase [Desulfocapsaceae bacterium]
MSLSSSQKAVLTGVVRGTIQWDAPLSAWTTYRIGGPADALVTLLDVEDLQEVLNFCRLQELRWKLLGKGSNILAADEGFGGIVIVLGEGFKYIGRDSDQIQLNKSVKAGAGISLARLSSWCADSGLSGFEFASGIPGTIGGAVAMNAGAWGRSMADIISSIEVVDHEKIEIISDENLGFSYRSCRALSGRSEAVVTSVTMSLNPAVPEQIRETIKTLREKRKERQPYGQPNCGSVFRNPQEFSAGKLIDEAGLKGRRIGDAAVSEKHANFIVNCGKATARDVLALIDEIKEKVIQTSGVELIPEVQFLR